MKRKRLSALTAAFTVALAMVAVNPGPAAGEKASSSADATTSAEYSVVGVRTAQQRSAIAATGAAVDGVEDGRLLITATPEEVRRIKALGFTVNAEAPPTAPENRINRDFPPSDSGYHTYAEMVTEIDKAVADHPTLISKQVIGRSHDGFVEDWALSSSSRSVPAAVGRPAGACMRASRPLVWPRRVASPVALSKRAHVALYPAGAGAKP